MRTCRTICLIAGALCFILATPTAGLAVSFGEFAGGIKTMTESAKDVNEIANDQKEDDKSSTSAKKSQKSQKKSSKKSSAPREDSRVRGG